MLTMEDRVQMLAQHKVKEHNEVSANLKYAGVQTEYYKGRLTELQNVLLDFAWELGVKVNFVTAVDELGNKYEKAIIAE